jgi:hypothetical protein
MAWIAHSTVTTTVRYDMNGVLRAMAGHRADPIETIEERTRTFVDQSPDEVAITDEYSRRYGGARSADTRTVRRVRRQLVWVDPAGTISLEPYLCPGEPPLNDANPNPKEFTACPTPQPPAARRYEDPGDAALAELPSGPSQPGRSWTFTRQVDVGREFASGTLTYVDTLQRLEQRGADVVAVIDVAASGTVALPPDLVARGFHPATMTLTGSAEFDATTGTPAAQHYTGHVAWHASILGVPLGLLFDETYDATAWQTAGTP